MQSGTIDTGRTLQITRRLGAAAVAMALSMIPAQGCEGLVAGPRGVVTGIRDGDTLVLDSGLVVRLIGLQAPKLPLGRDGFEAWPLAAEARDRLAALAMGQVVTIGYGGEQRDRHGRVLGQVFLADSTTWLQQELIAEGLGRVYSFADNRSCLDDLFAAERKARSERLGIWSDPYYTVRRADRPESLLKRAGHYELVEGRVLLADAAGGRVYLNFGRYWKVDFTAVIEARALRLFAAEGIDPLALEGALVRIRGWVDDRDGPRIDITHPEQIEVLAQR